MICPCGQYEYIDSTAKTLADAMTCEYYFQVAQINISLYTFFLLLLPCCNMQIIENMAIELSMKS